jgi:hypothetical protein
VRESEREVAVHLLFMSCQVIPPSAGLDSEPKLLLTRRERERGREGERERESEMKWWTERGETGRKRT